MDDGKSLDEANFEQMRTLQANRPMTMAHGARPNKFLKNYINTDLSSKASIQHLHKANESATGKDVSWKIVYKGCNFTVNTRMGG